MVLKHGLENIKPSTPTIKHHNFDLKNHCALKDVILAES